MIQTHTNTYIQIYANAYKRIFLKNKNIYTKVVTLQHMIIPSYPEKKVARPTTTAFNLIYQNLKSFQPECVHVTGDGLSHMFALAGIIELDLLSAYCSWHISNII